MQRSLPKKDELDKYLKISSGTEGLCSITYRPLVPVPLSVLKPLTLQNIRHKEKMPMSYKRKPKRKITYIGRLNNPKKSKTRSYVAPVSFGSSGVGARRSALGQTKTVKLNWVSRSSIPAVTSAGTFSAAEFAVNSAFKPDTILANGRQPMGYDQMSPLFDRYYVTSVKYKVSFWSGSNESRIVGVAVTDRQLGGLINFAGETLIEQGLSQWKTLTQNTSGPCTTTFEGTIDCPKVLGKTYQEYVADDLNGGLVTSSPTNGVFLYLYAGNADVGATLGLTLAYIELEMTIKFVGSQITPAS